MIVFDLACKCGYEFEGWFSHGLDFADQLAEGRIQCPACGCTEIRKILSPVTVQSASASGPEQPSDAGEAERLSLSKALHVLQTFVERNFDDVGSSFAQEALKMHYGATQERNIRGVATAAEEKALEEEGIATLKIPFPGRPQKMH